MVQIEGDLWRLFDGLSGRLKQFAVFGEAGPGLSGDYLGAQLDTASLRLFRHQTGFHPSLELEQYFSPGGLRKIPKLPVPGASILSSGLAIKMVAEERERLQSENRTCLETRLSVLESLLHIIPDERALSKLISDIKRIFAYSGVSLDIEGVPPLIIPLEQPLLQHGVLNNLLPRLSARYPARAQELIEAYQRLLRGDKSDEIFVGAFKTLEELARSLTGDPKFEFKAASLKRHFPQLHPTIHETTIKLAAHRGDKGGHGRAAPEPHEIRYLLFEICNTALLLLDHPATP